MEPRSGPRVSILLPVYNGERFLRPAVQRLVGQSYHDLEIVAVDDGSSDGSLDILRSFGDPRIRVERNERNLGLVATLNRGIELCRGEYIARMDADDVAHPERIEKQVRFLDDHPACILVATRRHSIDEEGRRLPYFNRPATGSPVIRWKLLTGNFITHPTVMLRKNVLPEALFDPNYLHAEDYEAWLKLSALGDLEVLPEKLLQYRFHAGAVGQKYKSIQVRSAMTALRDHLSALYEVEFTLEALALWSAPQDSVELAKPDDFYELLRWMNPLRSSFRPFLRGYFLWSAFGHYQRRLLLLLRSHTRRIELLWPVFRALAASLLPRR